MGDSTRLPTKSFNWRHNIFSQAKLLPVVNTMTFTFKRLYELADASFQIFGWNCISTLFAMW